MLKAFDVDVLIEDNGWDQALGGDAEAFCAKVLAAAATAEGKRGAVSVLLTTDETMQSLNRNWRGKDKPTNVLSFPSADGAGGLLGDVALGLGVVRAEAAAQSKTMAAHTAHMLVHGFLHLVGHDHEEESEAETMESRERAILATLGYVDPYRLVGGDQA